MKQKNIRNRRYLDWLKTQPCYMCGVIPCDPAHIRRFTDGGTGLKPSDCYALPLCRPHHQEQHAIGELSFYGGADKVYKAIDHALKKYEDYNANNN